MTSAISTATSVAPKTQSISFALRSSLNSVRCFSIAAPKALSRTVALRDEKWQREQSDQQTQPRERGTYNHNRPSDYCIFVQNYPYDVPVEYLSEAFSKFGEVVHIEKPPNKS